MGKFARQFNDLMSSIRSAWGRRARDGVTGPAGQPARSGRPRRDLGDLRRSEAARRAEAALRDVRTGDAGRRAQEAIRDFRESETARKAQETVREFRESERGRKAEVTIQEAEAAARAAYLRLRRSMGDR